MKNTNSRTITISIKVTGFEKMRYKGIAESHEISLSEWAASILNMYQDAYGELKINSYREDQLLAEIDSLKKENKILNALYKLEKAIPKKTFY
jgi:hypothetical protein